MDKRDQKSQPLFFSFIAQADSGTLVAEVVKTFGITDNRNS